MPTTRDLMRSKKPATAKPRSRVLIVDDHDVVREGLCAALPEPQYDVVGLAGTGADALALARESAPDVVLIDLRLPDMSGEDLCQTLRQEFPNLALVILTTYVSEETVRRTLQAGATAYVTKSAGINELLLVLEDIRVDRQDGLEEPQIVKVLHELVSGRKSAALLTPQQEAVLELAAQGFTNREIGDRLFISESTVRFHLQKLKGKFGARNKGDLIATAIRRGAIAPAEEGAARMDH